jgi:hypothetical protein
MVTTSTKRVREAPAPKCGLGGVWWEGGADSSCCLFQERGAEPSRIGNIHRAAPLKKIDRLRALTFCPVSANVDSATHALLRPAPDATCLDVLRPEVFRPELLDRRRALPRGVPAHRTPS